MATRLKAMLIPVLAVVFSTLLVGAPLQAHAASLARSAATAASLTDPNCVQPPATVDHAMLTPAQLNLYGLPHRAQGESLAQWQ